ncbi:MULTISPECIES: class I SAM-dependent methyltransferase [unclassified Chelatococcus]|uniref:class I SAM-dependent methyltransferase n=1 Tax=unclassified Chelatococcus TaxID=2638111 RepID=UPI001BCBCEEB|nr:MULTISPECIES: class I SAM-dependent methyltransferase [unclassified Chelatococcus]MBS7695765.1 class I SAM-dependent methyltransferase [Chelatococcus sp. YT9]MBX3555860.1 class I SAM-dependent methyltransferase [Chelatococcus sp.]
MNIANRQYWKEKSGRDYQQQQAYRIETGNSAYRQQEAWLLSYLEQERRRQKLDRPLRVLDFGCGFGRLAGPISALQGVAYHGYDFSSAMVADLLTAPPPALAEVARDRVRVADSIEAAFPTDCFDIIFTISVLIHNNEAQAQELISQMSRRLAPEGRLVLIENRLVAATLFQNTWHAGCWVHAFADYAAGVWDVAVIEGVTDQHGIYILAPLDGPRDSRFTYRDPSTLHDRSLDLEELRVLALSYTLEQLRGAPNGPPDPSGSLDSAAQARVHDLSERNTHLERVIREMREARGKRERLDETLGAVLGTARRPEVDQQPTPPARQSASPFSLWDIEPDTRYAHDVPGFGQVLHVFHKEWFGIRAAAGALPGRKLALSAEPVNGRVLRETVRAILAAGVQRIVFHGFSENTPAIVEGLAGQGFGERMFLVHHGGTTQWINNRERHYAFGVIDLLRRGRLRKAHFMRPGFDFPVCGLFRPLLFNLSPQHGASDCFRSDPLPATVFAPGWAGWIKNVSTNVLGAALSPSVEKIWVYAEDLALPPPLDAKLQHIQFRDREDTFRRMAASQMCLNASLIDCHPVVNLEAQSLGRPCIRGPLFLDALEDHPYVRLTQVDDVSAATEVRAAIERVLDIPRDEREHLTRDYQAQSNAIAIDRYREFLEL